MAKWCCTCGGVKVGTGRAGTRIRGHLCVFVVCERLAQLFALATGTRGSRNLHARRYSASAICFNTTKQLHMHWSVLTLAQLTVSSLLGAVALLCKIFPYQPITSSSQLHATVSLAAVFTGGFVTLNMALGLMHVSLVSSLRACEPAFTLLLAPFLVRVERMTWRTLSTMAIIVTGCLLSVAGNVELDAGGLAVMLVCNGLWALRAVLTKRLQRAIAVLDPASLFVHISCFGALLQCLVVLVCWLSSSAGLGAGGAGFRWGLGGGSDRWSEHRVLLVNVVSFHAYQLMSSLVLARVPLMTHAGIAHLRACRLADGFICKVSLSRP